MFESSSVAITTVLCFLVIVNVVGNSFVCLVIRRNRDMRRSTHYLLANLAVADIVYATFIAPDIIFTLSVSHPDGVTGSVLCKFLTDGNIAWIGAGSSIFILVFISYERYYSVIHPFSAERKLTKRKLTVIIPSSWILPLILDIPMFLVSNFDEERDSCVETWPEKWMSKANTLMLLAVVFISISVMVGLYSRIVYTLWFKRDNNHQLTYKQRGVLRVRKRVTLMAITISTIFGICWGTDVVVHLRINVASYSIGEMPVAISHIMVLFNSAVNPFVYALLSQQFRQKMKEMVGCTCLSSQRVQPKCQAMCIEPTNITPHTYMGEPCSME